jgi:hypothetical protein
VIDSHDVQNRRLKIMHVHSAINDVKPVVVRLATDVPTPDAPAHYPERKHLAVMMPSTFGSQPVSLVRSDERQPSPLLRHDPRLALVVAPDFLLGLCLPGAHPHAHEREVAIAEK